MYRLRKSGAKRVGVQGHAQGRCRVHRHGYQLALLQHSKRAASLQKHSVLLRTDENLREVAHHQFGGLQFRVLPHLLEESVHQGTRHIKRLASVHALEAEVLRQRGDVAQFVQRAFVVDVPHAFLDGHQQFEVVVAAEFDVDKIDNKLGLLHQGVHIGRIGRARGEDHALAHSGRSEAHPRQGPVDDDEFDAHAVHVLHPALQSARRRRPRQKDLAPCQGFGRHHATQ